MTIPVPYHPYQSVCLVCGSNGHEAIDESLKIHQLHRCSRCKQAVYCNKTCQKNDWKVHRRECHQLQDENALALALQGSDPDNYPIGSVTSGRTLRLHLLRNGNKKAPFRFVLEELRNFLQRSIQHWDQEETGKKLAVDRMNLLIEETDRMSDRINWLRLSSLLFGTCMVHNVINGQCWSGNSFKNNPWFQAFIFNFGEVLDRIKLFALLHSKRYCHFIPDSQFPLLLMKEPSVVGGNLFFQDVNIILVDGNKRCMICRRNIPKGSRIISSHDPERCKDPELSNMARQVNYLPPRPISSHSQMRSNPDESMEKFSLKLQTWLHMVARIRTFPKEYVCGDECEQHALYGRLFESHPLESSRPSEKSSSSSDED